MQQKALENTNKKSLIVIILTFIIIGGFFTLLNPHVFMNHRTRNLESNIGYKESSWVLRQTGSNQSQEITLPWFQKLERGELYTISTKLTYDGTKDSAPYGFIHADHLFCRILLDDEVLFSCMPEDIEGFGSLKTPGYIFKAFALPSDCRGKEMTIEIIPKMALDIEYGLPEIVFGDFESTFFNADNVYSLYNISIVVCILLGIFSILVSCIVLDGSHRREGFCVGAFSLVFSMYMITEGEFNAYLMANPYQTYIANYISFSLAPVFLLAFMRERLSEKVYGLLSVLMAGNSILFVAEIILHFANILDFREFIPILHIVFIFEVVLLFILIFTLKDARKKLSFIKQMIPLFIGIIMDVMSYWMHWNIGNCNAAFTIFGVLLFLAIEIYHIFKSGIAVYETSVSSKIYKELAYIDSLTGISNRRAYDEEISRIESQKQTYKSMIVVAADVNKLKAINDNYGHSEGDRLIRSAAQIMQETFGAKGKVFRTGGDEFMAFICDTEMSEYEKMLETVNRRADEFTGNNPYEMSIALGYVQICDKDVLQATIDADKRMYEQKLKHRMMRTE